MYFLSLSPPPLRNSVGPASPTPPEPRPQAVREDHPSPDGSEREAAPHPADVLQRQPATGRPDEGAAGGDDRPEPQGDPRVVSEQALQGQEEVHHDEAAPAAAAQRQNREFWSFSVHDASGCMKKGNCVKFSAGHNYAQSLSKAMWAMLLKVR